MRFGQSIKFPKLPLELIDVQRTGKARIQFQLNRLRASEGLEGINYLLPTQVDFKPACLARTQRHSEP